MTRKQLFMVAVASSAVSHLYFRTASEGPMSFIFHCVFMGFMMPGNVLCLLLEHVVPLALHSYIAATVLVSSLVWFFPLDRLHRLRGTFNAFGEGKGNRPSLVRGVADGLEALNKRLFGRRKTGGWA